MPAGQVRVFRPGHVKFIPLVLDLVPDPVERLLLPRTFQVSIHPSQTAAHLVQLVVRLANSVALARIADELAGRAARPQRLVHLLRIADKRVVVALAVYDENGRADVLPDR